MVNVSECYLYLSNTIKYNNDLGMTLLPKGAKIQLRIKAPFGNKVGLSVPAFWGWARKMPNSKRAPLLSLMQKADCILRNILLKNIYDLLCFSLVFVSFRRRRNHIYYSRYVISPPSK
jgi:hypothetical protein